VRAKYFNSGEPVPQIDKWRWKYGEVFEKGPEKSKPTSNERKKDVLDDVFEDDEGLAGKSTPKPLILPR
jgi:hypothetical protein